MVSLELNLTIWSLIIFGIQAISLIATMLVFLKQSSRVVLFVILLWLVSQVSYILYGYSTKQIGFLMLGIFNIIVSFIALFLNFGKIEDDEDEEDEEEYDNQ